MNFGDLKPVLDKILSLLKHIDTNTKCAACGSTNISTAGTGSIPAGLKSFSIIKTSSSADTVTITLSDTSTYVLTEQGEVFVDASTTNSTLPAYIIAGPGTWKWHGIQ